jgi:hypothetical protein
MVVMDMDMDNAISADKDMDTGSHQGYEQLERHCTNNEKRKKVLRPIKKAFFFKLIVEYCFLGAEATYKFKICYCTLR